MPSRTKPARGTTITLAAGLAFALLTLFSSAPLASATEDPAVEAAVLEQPAAVDVAPPAVDSGDVPSAGVEPEAPVEPGPPVVPGPPTDPAPPVEVPEPEPSDPPAEEPGEPAPEPTPEPTPEPSTPAIPAAQAPAALPPIPPPPGYQPPFADWSPGNPDVDEWQGSGDQGIPTVGVDGLIGDNYPMYYKNMPAEPVIWDEWNFAHRQCTSFVSWRLNQVNGVPFDNQYGGLVRWGNAGEWGDSARSLGIRVDKIPAAGAIAYSAPGTNGSGSAGHVAWVAKVLDDGRAVIEEYNAGAIPGLYGSRIVPADAFTGYIHLKDLDPVTALTTHIDIAPVALAAQGGDRPAADSILKRVVGLGFGSLEGQNEMMSAHRLNFGKLLLNRELLGL